VYLAQVSLLLIGHQGLVDFSGIGHCFPFAGGLCKFYVNAGENRQIQRQLLNTKQAPSLSSFINEQYNSTCD
jgi:hypothetical protein